MSIIFKIKTTIRRIINKKMNLNRPGSYPYISGDGFRSLAQHIFDDISDLHPEHVKENDVVFVRTDFIREFFLKRHHRIRNKYILISHNSDTNIDQSYSSYIDDKIIHWFSQNALIKHSKVTPIPIGLTNYHYSSVIDRGSIYNIHTSTRSIDITRKINRLGYGFVITNRSRISLLEYLKKNDIADNISEERQIDYFKNISSYKFIISPDGNGADCFRTWEAIYLKTIPIVIKNNMHEYFRDIKLPLYMINSWNELDSLNEDLLNKKYRDILDSSDDNAAYIDYWYKEIDRHKIQ